MVGMMEEPKGMKYWYIDEKECWQIEDDAPAWAKKEFEEFMSDSGGSEDVEIATNY